MKRRHFLQHSLLVSGALAYSPWVFADNGPTIKIHFLRHATFLLDIGGLKLLIDPMFGKKEIWDPLGNAASKARIPMVDLPLPESELATELKKVDAVLVTHTHFDHWDKAAQQMLDKQLPLIIQSSDEKSIRAEGFTNLLPVDKSIDFKGLKIHRTGGQHGTGEVGRNMGQVSGFVIQYGKRSMYIAGDTIWCAEVEKTLMDFKPDISILNAGAARFLQGDPITMTAEDVLMVAKTLPSTHIIAMHMDTINHCVLSRAELRKFAATHQHLQHIVVPENGEKLML
jgi:L-ascorbate metabolism protein UlaG (beta-lactamase superfamily)